MVRHRIVSVETFNVNLIYHSCGNNYSEDTHRALCSIYLGLIPFNASGFRMITNKMPKDMVPWYKPGTQYVSSADIRLRKEQTEVSSMEGVERNLKRHRS